MTYFNLLNSTLYFLSFFIHVAVFNEQLPVNPYVIAAKPKFPTFLLKLKGQKSLNYIQLVPLNKLASHITNDCICFS